MPSITRRRGSQVWTAFFRDSDGRQYCKSTHTTDRKLAQKVAEQYEGAARKTKSWREVMRTMADIFGAKELTGITLRAHASSWLKLKDAETSHGTMQFYRGSVDRFLEFLGPKADKPLFEVTKADLVAYRNNLLSNVSARTTGHLLGTVKALFRAALADDLISDNPSEFVAAPKKERKAEGRRAFTIAELKTVLELASGEWRSMVMFGLYTGQRLSDLATLTWSNVDLVKGQVRLETRKTRRVMTIPIAESLAQHIESLPSSDDPRAFIHPTLSLKKQASLSAEFTDLLIAAGLRQPAARLEGTLRRRIHPLSFHSIRHSTCSLLKDAGIPQAVVEELIGHETAEMSARYTHVGITSLQQGVGALPKLC